MKRFLHRLACFAALAGVLYAAGEWQARRMYPGSNTDLGFKVQLFNESGCPYQNVVIGSSWAEESVIPTLLAGGGFNLGYPLQDVYYGTELLRRVVLPRCSKLRRVIIVVGYPSFAWDLLADANDNFLTHEYARDFGIPVEDGWPAALRNVKYDRHLSVLYDTRQRFPYDLLGYRLPPAFRASREIFAEPRHWPQHTMLGDGYRYSDHVVSPAELAWDASLEVRLRYTGWHTPRVEANLERLAGTLDLLHARGIRTVLLQTPYTPAYRHRIPAEYQDGFRRAMSELLQRCRDDELEFRDYSADPLFTADMFRDADHLNYRGAMVLTRMLDQPQPQPPPSTPEPPDGVRLRLTRSAQ